MDIDLIALILVVLAAITLPFIFYFINNAAKCDFLKNKNSLEMNGYVIEHGYQKDYGNITVCWGRFSQPLPLYLRVSNRSLANQLIANLGFKDIKTGDMIFDKSFVLRSNHPKVAINILNSFKSELLKFTDIEFQTGSIDNMLNADYWPGVKKERKDRKLWKLTTQGKLTDEQMQPYREVAQRMVVVIECECKAISLNTDDECKTKAFEGR